jgi:SAM-dependent methyltransferase
MVAVLSACYGRDAKRVLSEKASPREFAVQSSIISASSWPDLVAMAVIFRAAKPAVTAPTSIRRATSAPPRIGLPQPASIMLRVRPNITQRCMSLEETNRNWQQFAEQDPLWAVLTLDGKRGNRWNEDEFFATGRAVVDDLLAWAADCGAVVHFDRALDFGCGVGRLTQALASRFQSVVGVDVAPAMIERARSLNRLPDRCSFVLNNAENLAQFQDQSIDLLLSVIVLQHIEPPHVRTYLAEFLRLLKPGGVLVFQLTAEPRARLHFAVPAPSLKQRVLSAVPVPLLNAYARAKGALKGLPEMKAWGIPPREVQAHLEHHGGRVLAVAPDDWGGPAWTSNHYCVIKQG